MANRQCGFVCENCHKRCNDRPEQMNDVSVLCDSHEMSIVYDDTVKCQYCKKINTARTIDHHQAAKFFGNIKKYREKLVDEGEVTKEMMENPRGNRAIVALAKERQKSMKNQKFEHEFMLRALVNEDGSISLRLKDDGMVFAKNVKTGAGTMKEYDFEIGDYAFEEYAPKLRKNRKELKTALKNFFEKNKIKVSK